MRTILVHVRHDGIEELYVTTLDEAAFKAFLLDVEDILEPATRSEDILVCAALTMGYNKLREALLNGIAGNRKLYETRIELQ